MKLLRNLAIICSAFILFSLSVEPAPAQGPAGIAPENMQTMTYEVYAGGINAVTAEMAVTYDKKTRYRLAFKAQTKGFLGKLVPWSGTFETEGWAGSDSSFASEKSDRPELHKSTAVWRGEKEIKTYKYNRKGEFLNLVITEDGKEKSRKKPDDALTQGTTDALTAMLAVMKNISETGKCEGKSEVFDGKRRFELIFTHEANDALSATRYNTYEGIAARCQVEVKPLTGAWHKKPRGWMSIQEQGRKKGTMPTVWMADMDGNGGPAVPVKVRVKTDYGTLFMHLVHYKNGDREQSTKNHRS